MWQVSGSVLSPPQRRREPPQAPGTSHRPALIKRKDRSHSREGLDERNGVRSRDHVHLAVLLGQR
jgi:hypothetical protein